MRNISLEKSYTKYSGETIPRSFSKKQRLSNLWVNSLKFHTVCFQACQVEGSRKIKILKYCCRPVTFTTYS